MPFIVFELLGVAIVYGIYALICLGLIRLFRKLRVSSPKRIFASLLILGVMSGVIATVLWPNDISVLFNIPAVLIGDKIYIWSINLLGDPSSPHAHYTIPWLLRIPQVYVIVSVLFWGLVGLVAQLVHNRKGEFNRLMRSHRPRLKGHNA